MRSEAADTCGQFRRSQSPRREPNPVGVVHDVGILAERRPSETGKRLADPRMGSGVLGRDLSGCPQRSVSVVVTADVQMRPSKIDVVVGSAFSRQFSGRLPVARSFDSRGAISELDRHRHVVDPHRGRTEGSAVVHVFRYFGRHPSCLG